MKNGFKELTLFGMAMLVSLLHIAKISKTLFVQSTLLLKESSSASILETNKTQTTQQTNHSSPSVVVVYTGPTKNSNVTIGKNEIYHKNFDYFLKHGIDCSRSTASERQDTVLVLTPQVAKEYQSKISSLQDSCRSGNGNVIRVLERQDRCYDMESMRVVLQNVDLSRYDYLVYLNCGLVGPKYSKSKAGSWTQVYTSLLSDKIKMSGLTINCKSPMTHVQSMLFAVDRVGLRIIQDANVVYDCGKSNAAMTPMDRRAIIYRYEMGMGTAILEAGYGLR